LRNEWWHFKDTNLVNNGFEIKWNFGFFEPKDANKPEVAEISEPTGNVFGEKNS
jgi:hypothetical protein